MSNGKPNERFWTAPRIRAAAALVALFAASLIWRLRGLETDDTAVSDRSFVIKLDPNVASAADLAALPRLGPSVARRIVEYREVMATKGKPSPFRTLADLDEVVGIGEGTLEQIEEYLVFPP